MDRSNLSDKNPKFSEWLKERQSTLKIAKTTKTPSGQTLDWVPIDSQTASGHIAAPPPAKSFAHSQKNGGTTKTDWPVTPVSFELQHPSVEQGPPNTVPILRPDISHLTRTIQLKDYFSKRGGLALRKRHFKSQPTAPSLGNYYHCTNQQIGTFFGADGQLNVWDPVVNVPSNSGDDHSIIQFWIQNGHGIGKKGQVLHSIEGGWTVDHNLNGNLRPHLFIYYTTNSYAKDGHNLGGYNRQHAGWVQVSSTVYPGAELEPLSVFNGDQYVLNIQFQFTQDPLTQSLNWWIGIGGTWMGYYPDNLFKGGLADSADFVSSGGEVATGLKNPDLTSDFMGSGWQAQNGWMQAAFLFNLRNQTDLDGTMVDFNGTPELDTPDLTAPHQYNVQSTMQSGTPMGSFCFLGGPMGGRSPFLYWIGGAQTDATPFVSSDNWVYFRGTDHKLFKVTIDGFGLQKVGTTGIASTPWVTTDGWVWFQGSDNKLYKIFNDGSQLSQPGNNKTTSSPVVVNGCVYFRGDDDKLFRMQTDGTALAQVGANKTNAAPFVTTDGWIYFRETNGKLFKVATDGTGLLQIGTKSLGSTPWVTADGWVWFQGSDNKLYKIFNDGSQLSQPGNNKTISSPTVAGLWVYFRGNDDKLFRMQTDGTQQTNPGGNKTSSAPAAIADSVYFRGTGDNLWRYFFG